MAGRVLGKHFHDVIGQLLVHSEAAPAVIAGEHAMIAAIDPQLEFRWEDFVATLVRVAASVRAQQLVIIGERLAAAARPEFERWGFDTAEKVLADWDAPFGASIIDAPEDQTVITLKYQPGQAFLRAGAVLPAALIEGYIRGVVATFGAELLELARHRVVMDGEPYNLFEVRWRASAVPRVIPRRTTDRLKMAV